MRTAADVTISSSGEIHVQGQLVARQGPAKPKNAVSWRPINLNALDL